MEGRTGTAARVSVTAKSGGATNSTESQICTRSKLRRESSERGGGLIPERSGPRVRGANPPHLS